MSGHYRLAIVLPAYDPYKDVFDIFIEQFKKNWPDCPYPLVIANMYFQYDGENVIIINCGDIKDAGERLKIICDNIDADYYLSLEEDRIMMSTICTEEVEKILDFMDKESVPYFRCNRSVFRKKKENQFPGYPHYYHIPGGEPYGVCGATVIWSKKMMKYLNEEFNYNGYKWESYQNQRAAFSKDKWVENYATADRNVFHILHCIAKQKWIPSARIRLIREGYVIRKGDRGILSPIESMIFDLKRVAKIIPGKIRYKIKRGMRKFGIKFYTEY